ncbi:MAG: hypothetical protein ACFFC3_02900 [Candidatus Odinarchaeota archaeon]
MEKKDIILGILLIAVVGISGGLGYVLLTWQPKPSGTTTYETGLPDDFSTAPTTASFMLNNQTHTNITITLADLLNFIEIYENTEEGAYETGIGTSTVIDPNTNIPITGVRILDVLEAYHTYFAGELNFGGLTFSTTGQELVNKILNKKISEEVIIGISADKKWLADSPYGSIWGDFMIIGENMPEQIFQLEEINVVSNWTLDVYVDDVLELSLEPNDLIDIPESYSFSYSYDRTDDWSLNRTYWGVNISTICDWVGLSEIDNFSLYAHAADGWAAPHLKKRGLTTAEVYHGLEWNSTYWGYINETESNPDGVPLIDGYDDLPISIAYALQYLGEYDGESNATNDKWPTRKICGYSHGPFVCVIPGTTRGNLVKYIYKIEIIIN